MVQLEQPVGVVRTATISCTATRASLAYTPSAYSPSIPRHLSATTRLSTTRYSITDLLTYSLNHLTSLTHSLTQSYKEAKIRHRQHYKMELLHRDLAIKREIFTAGTHSLTHLLTHSPNHLLTQSHTSRYNGHSLTYSLTYSLTHSLTHSLRWWRMIFYGRRGRLHMRIKRLMQRKQFTLRNRENMKYRSSFVYQVLTHLLTHSLTHSPTHSPT